MNRATVRGLWPRRSPGAGRLALIAALAGCAAAAAIEPARPVVHTAEECASLMRQYDSAAPAHHAATHAEAAATRRADGERACREGRYGEGVDALRRALHDIGIKPVRITPVPHA